MTFNQTSQAVKDLATLIRTLKGKEYFLDLKGDQGKDLAAICEKYFRMEEMLKEAAGEACYCEWDNCSHDKASEALEFDPI